MVKRCQEALLQARSKSHAGRILPDPKTLTARDIFDAAAKGDTLADKIVEDTAFYLAVGATNMMHIIDPDMIVFGGGMIAAGEGFLNRIKKHVHKLAFPVPAPGADLLRQSRQRCWPHRRSRMCPPVETGISKEIIL